MSEVHIHLLITHLPIFGSILGGLVLAYALWSKSNQTKIAAYGLLVFSTFGATIAYLTGEGAEEAVEDIQGVAEKMIEQHEDFALIALVSLIILGAISLVGMFLSLKNHPLSRTIAFVALTVSLISFGLVARTGYLGGQIRHTELNPNASNQLGQGNEGGEKDGDDD